MKKYLLMASALGLLACSESTEPGSAISQSNESVKNGEMVMVSATAAKTHIANYRRSVAGSWSFSDGAKDQQVSLPVDSLFKKDNFAVDADVVVEDDGVYTIASAGVDGDAFAWMLQVENGSVVFSWRNSASDDWRVFKSEKCIDKDVTKNVRFEYADHMFVFFVDGDFLAAFKEDGTLDMMNGSFTIGFDSFDSDSCHCHGGHVDQVDLENVDSLKTTVDSVKIETEVENPSEWIAHWSFDDSTKIGKDFSGNGHDAKLVDGVVTSVDGIANFDGKSGYVVDLDKDLAINDFVVEARVKPVEFGTMQNIIVAEPPGRYGDGWMVRADEGFLTVHFRDESVDDTEWNVFTGKKLALNEWNEIRVERSKDSLQVFQNGEMTIAAAYKGDISQMTYNWGIAYDAMMQNFHDRGFIGEIDYVRFGKFTGFSDGVLTASAKRPLAAWEFNEPSYIGLDKIANNSTRMEEGNPVIKDSTVTLDGLSGLYIDLSRTFKRNVFSVETRVKPTAFAPMQNIFAAEPPGRYGDGWVIRVDDGVLIAQFRDEETDGVKWNVFSGEKLALNEWNDIRVVRTDDSVRVFQNGKQTVSAAYAGDVSQLSYDIGLGYDAMNQNIHDRGFVGEIDYIRYYGE